mmetsp:Transcript_4623/g.16419  ORF Transcript_4623/g.16419 Transcript_4623/m.16419 type:complete len:254 (-) Transcript_4623:1297-2058(-)
MHPNSVKTPNVPALSNALKKMSGYASANAVGGNNATAHGFASPFDVVFIPSARKSVRPNTNPRKLVLTAKNENPLTSAFAASEDACSVASGSGALTPCLNAASTSSTPTLPSTAASHSANIANGMNVPAMIATRIFDLSPSSDDDTTGMTLWKTNASAMTGIVSGTAVQSPRSIRFRGSAALPASASSGKNSARTITTSALLNRSIASLSARNKKPPSAATYSIDAAGAPPGNAGIKSTASSPTLATYATNSA